MSWLLPILFNLEAVPVFAGYSSADLFTVQWGTAENQLVLLEKVVNDPGTPGDPSDDYTEPARGPHMAIVDGQENVTVISFSGSQFKGFSSAGQLIFDFSLDRPRYDAGIFYELPENIYVDSLSHLYVQSDPGTQYVPVVDYTGQIVERIRPFTQDSSAYIHFMNWSPTGTLFFFNRIYGWVTYSNGQSASGGSTGSLASNASFYTAHKKTANSLEFKRFENPDSTGLAESRELTEVPVAVDTLVAAGLINGGDGQSLYVIMSVTDYDTYEIWRFNLSYDFIDKLVLPVEQPYQDLRILPFVRRDGNIYEFRFREDGFHVVRWTRE